MGKKVLLIPGNHESEKEVRKAISELKNISYIDESYEKVDNVLVFGYGGGGFSLVDPEFEKLAKKFQKIILPRKIRWKFWEKEKEQKKKEKVILMTHAPPYDTKVDLILEDHCGTKSITDFIKKVKPDLVVCGHLHETAGVQDKIGTTKIINPGPYGKVLKI